MTPSPLLPRGQPPWMRDRGTAHGSDGRPPEPGKGLSEEKLADYHIRHLHGIGIRRTLAGLLVLTVAAAVVIIPFVYMLLISLKGPSQVGNGRLLPDELGYVGSGRAAWIEVSLPGEQAIRLYSLEKIPVLPSGRAAFTPWPEPKPLPQGTVNARRLLQEKADRASPNVSVLLEAPDPTGALASSKQLLVYLPSEISGLWTPIEGIATKRTLAGVMGRMLNNYAKLLNLGGMRAGSWIDWFTKGYPRWYFNSLLIAISTVLLGVFLDSLAAFAFAKYQFPFKRILFALLIATLMIPYPVTLVPSFFIFAKLGFYNTYAALIIPGIVSAFGIFLVRQYMQNVPDEMLHAARVDGASEFKVYRLVMLPAAAPVLAALAVFRFIYQWNTYLFPLVLTNKDSMKTVQLGIATMEDMHGTVDYGMQMAGSALAVIPILVVYAFMQKHFIAGITMGSGKG